MMLFAGSGGLYCSSQYVFTRRLYSRIFLWEGDRRAMSKDFGSLILAAGQGTRMKSELLKVLHPIMGIPMVSLVVDAVKEAGITKPAVVIGHQGDKVRQTLKEQVRYVHQEEQRGTGHAVMVASEWLEQLQDVLVLYGDTPLVTPGLLNRLMKRHRESSAAATLLTAEVDDPEGLGRVVRDEQGEMVSIVEEADASHAESAINEINTAIACFKVEPLLEMLPLLEPDNEQGEYYLPDVFELQLKKEYNVQTVKAADAQEVIGVNTRRGLAEATEIFRARIIDEVMARGVTVTDPATTWISPHACIEQDTVILPFTTLEGHCKIGKGCRIGPMAHLANSNTGCETQVWYSMVEDSQLGDGVVVGPFAHLRPGNIIADEVKIGNFAELKNSEVGRGSKIPHHSYVGDASLGDDINMGAGAITVNYDGRKKHQTTIKNGAFVGCNSNLIAPLRIGERGFVAAGSTVSEDVPPESLAIERAQHENREGWVRRRFPIEEIDDDSKTPCEE